MSAKVEETTSSRNDGKPLFKSKIVVQTIRLILLPTFCKNIVMPSAFDCQTLKLK